MKRGPHLTLPALPYPRLYCRSMSKRWLQCGVLGWPGGFMRTQVGPTASTSREGEELAAWGELQEEGGPEALAGGKKSRWDATRSSCHPAPAMDMVPVSVGFAPSPQ